MSYVGQWEERALGLVEEVAALTGVAVHSATPGLVPEDVGGEPRRLLAAERCVERLRAGITADESRLAFALDKTEDFCRSQRFPSQTAYR